MGTFLKKKSRYMCMYIYILFHILFHYDLSQDIEYSALSYALGSCHLSILYSLYLLVPNCEPMFPQHCLPLGNCKSVSYAWKSVSISSLMLYFRFHIQVIWYGICFSLSSLSTLISMFIHVAENGIISFFLWLVIHCTHTPHIFFF